MTTRQQETRRNTVPLHLGMLVGAIVLTGPASRAAGQLPGTGQLTMPAIIQRATSPEAVEMWQRSAVDPSALFSYLDRPVLRQALETKSYDAEKLAGLLLNLEKAAVERLGDIANASLITRIESYIAERTATGEPDAAMVAKLAIERIRFRGIGRDA